MATNNALNAPIPFSLANGGTGDSLTGSLGGIPYSTTTELAILAGTATARQMLQSGASAAPAWSTATWPDTTTINQLLYSSAANTVAGIATANSGVLTTTSTGVPGFIGPLINGQVIVGSTGATPVAATITGGAGITVTNGAGTITIASNGIDPTWNVVSGTTQTMVINNGYIANNAGLVTLTLPSTAAVGSEINVVGLGAGGWKIAQNASQLIRMGNAVTTTGTGGSISSSSQYDSVHLVCIVANTTWTLVSGPQGNITYV